MDIAAHFKECSVRYAKSVALVYEGNDVTYASLKERSDRILKLLTEGGVPKGAVVGIHLDEKVDAVAAIIAVLSHHSAYLPLDSMYPAERLAFMMENGGTRWLISDSDGFLPEGVNRLDLRENTWVTAAPSGEPPTNAQHLAYVIYTSGSTGKPKGVMLPRAVLSNLIEWQNQRYPEGTAYKTVQFASFCFDVSFQEIFSTLLMGGTLYLLNPTTKNDFRALLSFLIDNKIERLFMPYIALLNLAQWACRLNTFPVALKEVITAGEQLVINAEIRRLFKACSGARLLNQYGPSESHVVTEYRLPETVDDWEDIPPIGYPIQNAEIAIVDDELKPVPSGTLGELLIYGDVLADGYINNPDETEKRFVTVEVSGERVRAYRTGDIAEAEADGLLRFKGRADGQVKISGYRIELSEIEKSLMTVPNILEAAVSVVGKTADEKRLIAFVVAESDEAMTSLPDSLAKALPTYMLPKEYHRTDKLFRTVTGKIDRKRMVDKWRENSQTPEVRDGTSGKLVLDLLREEMDVPSLTPKDNLVDYGLDSLMANRLAAAFFDRMGMDIPPYLFFQYRDVEGLIALMERRKRTVTEQFPVRSTALSRGERDVAIIGISLDVPGASTVSLFWQNLIDGRENIHFFEETTADGLVNARGVLSDSLGFDASFFSISPGEASFIDPQQRRLLELAWHALEDAGYTPETFAGRIGVYCGTGNNSYYLENVLTNSDAMEEFGPFQAMIANEKDFSATRIAHKLNLTGPAVNIQSACSTSLVAVCEAVTAIRAGACDIAIAGGASITFPEQQPYTHEAGGILSRDGHTRAFDSQSSGTVFSDGAGLIVLKRLDLALMDGDSILAAIKGVGLNNDGADKGSFSAPSIEGQKRVISTAQADAGINATEVGYVEAHGTGTPLGDPIEVAALREAFSMTGSGTQHCYLGSVKSNLGHLTAASGVVGLIKAALAIDRGTIPPSINFERPNPALNLESSPFKIADRVFGWDVPIAKRIAGVSSFGIGGTNAHVVLGGIETQGATEASDSPHFNLPLCLSAKSKPALTAMIEQYLHLLTKEKDAPLDRLTEAALTTRSHLRWRFAAEGADVKEMLGRLRAASEDDFDDADKIPSLVFGFPGQGAQAVHMGRKLYDTAPAFREMFDRCSELSKTHGIDLKKLVFDADGELSDTENTQIALFSVCMSLVATLEGYGIRPDCLIGHSIGELVAATVSGVFDLETAVRIVVTRGRVMQAQEEGDMAAVRADPEVLRAYLTDEVVLAAVNAPGSCTISGPSESVSVALEKLSEDGISGKILITSHAYHSPMMNGAAKAFVDALKGVKLSPPTIPFISCVTGEWITDADATNIQYWAKQITSAVLFKKGCDTVIQDGNTKDGTVALLEVGPRQIVSGLFAQTLAAAETVNANDIRCITTMAKPASNEYEQLTAAIGKLWQLGVDVAWPASLARRGGQTVKLPHYPFQRKVYEVKPGKPTGVATGQLAGSIVSLSVAGTRENPLPSLMGVSEVKDMKTLILSEVKDLFSTASGNDLADAADDASFFELGLDSLFLTQAVVKLKKKFNVAITFRELMGTCDSFDKLAGYLEEKGVTVVSASQAGTMPTGTVPMMTAGPALNIQAPEAGTNGALIGLMTQQMQLISTQMALLTQLSSPQNVPVMPGIQAPGAASPAAPSSRKRAAETPKKTFGAGTRIKTARTNDITPIQETHLSALMDRYNTKFKKSKAFAQENRKQLADPRVVSGFRPALKELVYPIVVERSDGPYLYDIDGNRFIDITCGFGSNFFGFSPPFIKDAVKEQLDKGYEIGPQNPLVADVSKMFCRATGMERVAFCNTGSEAVLGAVRLARTVTAKDQVVMFENDYHGINDEVIVHRTGGGTSSPAAAGIPESAAENTVILDYGEDLSLDYIRDNADSIAAVLVEPVQSRRPDLQPKAFLQKLRTLCTQHDVALIFDEVITGFRIHPKGAQGYFDVHADIATYGKVVGGGMPIGVIAGNGTYMDALDGGQWQFGDNSAPEVGVTYFAGTFVRHPLALAAANAVLKKLEKEPDTQHVLNEKTDRMTAELNDYFDKVAAPLKAVNCGSLFRLQIPQDIAYEELIFVLLREKGIHVWDARPCFLTTAHRDEDIAAIVSSIKEAVNDMLRMTFFPQDKEKLKAAARKPLDSSKPPVPGARLGKDPNGNPAWYIADPENPGKYLMIGRG